MPSDDALQALTDPIVDPILMLVERQRYCQPATTAQAAGHGVRFLPTHRPPGFGPLLDSPVPVAPPSEAAIRPRRPRLRCGGRQISGVASLCVNDVVDRPHAGRKGVSDEAGPFKLVNELRKRFTKTAIPNKAKTRPGER